MPELIKRTKIKAWLNIDPAKETETWALVGNKTNDLSYAYNPQVNTEQSVTEDVADTSLDGYQIAIDGEMKCYFGDQVYDYINSLRYNLAIGEDAVTTILLVDEYNIVSEDTTKKFKAQIFKCTVSVNTYGGAGGETPTLAYSIGLSGNPKQGTVTMTGGKPTFTETIV